MCLLALVCVLLFVFAGFVGLLRMVGMFCCWLLLVLWGCVFVGCGFVVFVSCVLVGFVGLCGCWYFVCFGVYFSFVFAGFVAVLLVVDMFFLLLAVAFLFCCPLHAFSFTLFLFFPASLPFGSAFISFCSLLSFRIRLKHLQGIFLNCKQERSGAVVSLLGS